LNTYYNLTTLQPFKLFFGYIQFIQFLSFDEFKIVKMWEEWDADMGMMPPAGACAALRRRGATFLVIF
jgi:hypothetical protein